MKVSELFEFMKQSKKKKTKETRSASAKRKKQAQIKKWQEGPVYKALTKPELTEGDKKFIRAMKKKDKTTKRTNAVDKKERAKLFVV